MAIFFQKQWLVKMIIFQVTAVSLLKKLVDRNIRVLLDVGALMLELDNEQVSRKWLELLNDANVTVDAAVFFDANDKLMVQRVY